MALIANPQSSAFPHLRPMLMLWAKHLAHTEEAQKQLVERTIAIAANDSAIVMEQPINEALLQLMCEIAIADSACGPRASLDKPNPTPGHDSRASPL